MESGTQQTKHYFVDEAGDPVLFDARGRVIVGQEGCSTHFIMGVLDVAAPDQLAAALQQLRGELLADPFFRKVPSMTPGQRKTAVMFHAKDDIPEVRWEVFKLLQRASHRFYAVVREKQAIVSEVRSHNLQSLTFRYSANWLYDSLVARLFKDRLHKDDQYRVCFAKRGKSDRTAALKGALERARDNFRRKWKIESGAPIEVSACDSAAEPCLQATDYFLWALQRCFARGEDRYIGYLWEKVALIHDVDDRRQNPYGAYYSQKKPLEAGAIKKPPGI